MIKVTPVTIDKDGRVVFLKENTENKICDKICDDMDVNDFIIKIMSELGLTSDDKRKATAEKDCKKFQNDNTKNQEIEKLKATIRTFKEANSKLKTENAILEKEIEELNASLKELKEENKRIKAEAEFSLERYESRSVVERIDNKLTIKKYLKGSVVNTQTYTVLENGEIFKEYGFKQLIENIKSKEGKEKFYQALLKTDFKINVILQYLDNTQHWIARAYVNEFLPMQKNESHELTMFRECVLSLINFHEQYYKTVARKNYKFMD